MHAIFHLPLPVQQWHSEEEEHNYGTENRNTQSPPLRNDFTHRRFMFGTISTLFFASSFSPVTQEGSNKVRAMAFQEKEQITRTTGQKTGIGEGSPLGNTERVSLTVDSCLEHFEFVFRFVVFPVQPGNGHDKDREKGHKKERKRSKNIMGKIGGD
ncbi:hypothetical protein CEXT_539201 [Caerostris extrusa]|uniref:Uncharacterized protein n=1 Tax=Caerostris extrusa TaxID=172846 RepID=A0AAV4WPD1_CAEEX|nr:hypothetical protein CEXT_539201 [Caerostris extrusa]